MANELILAVDDEAHILELLSFNLEASGYRVVTAATGEDALVVCAHERPAMVLLDIMLPGIDGMEVCRRLKSAPTTADIPIIMLTAKGDEVDKILGLELGADDYITKPFSVRELIARVKALLRRAAPQASWPSSANASARPKPACSCCSGRSRAKAPPGVRSRASAPRGCSMSAWKPAIRPLPPPSICGRNSSSPKKRLDC